MLPGYNAHRQLDWDECEVVVAARVCIFFWEYMQFHTTDLLILRVKEKSYHPRICER